MNGKQKIKIVLVSTGCLLAGVVLLQFTEWLFLILGAFVSGFQGHILWNDFVFYIQNNKWDQQQVVFLYLFPEILFFLLFLTFLVRKNHFKGKNRNFSIWNSWFFLLVMIKALFLPFWQIMKNRGIHYAFSWLGLSGTVQGDIGFFLLGLFFFYIFRMSSMFSYGLVIRENKFLKPRDILPQLFYIWLIPFLIFSLVIYFISGRHLEFSIICCLVGIAGTLLINIPVISNYQVIAK